MIVVAAAGNGPNSPNHCGTHAVFGEGNAYLYPAAYDNVISVSGVSVSNDELDAADSFFEKGSTNNRRLTFNDRVDVVAPGWSVLTLHYDAAAVDYYAFSGTSFAAPMVAGAVALMIGANPDLTPKEVESILKRTSNKSIFDTNLHPENASLVNIAGGW